MDVELEEYTQYQETKLHEKPGFAYETYLCTIPLDFDRVNLHWHDQMEVIYIKKGRGTVSVNLESYPVEAGCIVPVLPGELHAIDGAPDGPMEYENIIFSLSILNSTETDDWCRHHVIQALRQGTLLFDRPIRPGNAFHDAAAAALDAADRACEARPQGFEQTHQPRVTRTYPAFKVFFQGPGQSGTAAAGGKRQHERAVLHMGRNDEIAARPFFQRPGHVAEHARSSAEAGYGRIDLGRRRGREDQRYAFDILGAEGACLADEGGAVQTGKGFAEGGFVHAGVEHQQRGRGTFEQSGGLAAAHTPCTHQQTAAFGKIEEERIVAHERGYSLSGGQRPVRGLTFGKLGAKRLD